MKKIILSEKIRYICPRFIGTALFADVRNSAYSDGLWQEIAALELSVSTRFTVETIKELPSVSATRKAYHDLGKDPSRYRPSGEQLLRRVVQGRNLYQINTLVDLINYASMRYGYSIGGFDEDAVAGEEVTLGVGQHDEPYDGIGRGVLNIEHMPVYRDSLGGIGTPTSDNERTKIHLDTRRLLVFVNGYDGNESMIRATTELMQDLLRRYCCSDGGRYILF